MRGTRLHPLAFAAFCLMAGPAAAADDEVRLKLQPGLIRLPPHLEQPTPVFIEADKLQGHQDRETEAEGNARLRRYGKNISGDFLRYSKPDDEVTAEGNVRIEQYGDVMEGARLKLNVETHEGYMDSPRYTIPSTGGHGEAKKLVFEGEEKFRVQDGSYTTCTPAQEDWWLRAHDLEIDKARDVGIARGATIEFYGTPILYAPYLDFSLHTQRKSGFLSPTFGTTSTGGAEFTLPYYWNIAPNRDATFSPRYISKRGLLLGNEFRYLEPKYSGELHFDNLSNDRVHGGDSRNLLFLKHTQVGLPGGWNASLNVQKVSDDEYFRDLSTNIALTSLTTLPREGTLSRGGSWGSNGAWGFSALLQRWQTLQDPLAPITPPYNRQPQLTFGAAKQNVYDADFIFNSSYVDFTHPTLANGKRWVAFPTLSLPLQTSYAYVTPKVGMHLTRYDLDSATTSLPSTTRAVPIFSTEAGLVLERDTTLRGERYVQTLEPKLFYVYIPTRNQSLIPNFDSGVQDINFATLFTENQFSGNDRINDANQVTFGLTSRMLDVDTGIERLRAAVAERYYFKTQEVTLPGTPVRTSNSSDLLGTLSGTVARYWTAEAGWQYTTAESQTQKLSAGARYQPEPGKVLNMSYRYTRDSIRQVDLSTQWPVAPRWSAVARWNYSLQDSFILEALGGVEYDGGCWAFRAVAHRIATGTANAPTSFFLQLELNGVSKLGSNPLDVLRQNILGYTRNAPRTPANEWYPTQ